MMTRERQNYDRDFKQKAVELSFARGNAKEIAEDGSMKIDGLTKRVGLIAIDKHGNDSKPFNLE